MFRIGGAESTTTSTSAERTPRTPNTDTLARNSYAPGSRSAVTNRNVPSSATLVVPTTSPSKTTLTVAPTSALLPVTTTLDSDEGSSASRDGAAGCPFTTRNPADIR